jgi:hypothetical protein
MDEIDMVRTMETLPYVFGTTTPVCVAIKP